MLFPVASSSAPIALVPGEVHVWMFSTDISAGVCRRYRELLSPEEIARADRFKFEADRMRYTAARGMLRIRLGGWCDTRPENLVFRVGSHGKPSLQVPSTSIQFNVSHSGSRAVIAATRSRRCGVDIEKVRSRVHAEEIAAGFFCMSENDWLQSLPAVRRVDAFFRMWVMKEAILKAHGGGLSIPLADIDTTSLLAGRSSTISLSGGDERGVSLWTAELNVTDGYASALSVEGSAPKVLIFHEACEAE